MITVKFLYRVANHPLLGNLSGKPKRHYYQALHKNPIFFGDWWQP